MPAKFVIHTVGPVYSNGKRNEDELLKSCYLTSLNLAVQNNIKIIAFPAISCGIYRFPIDRAAKIAVETVKNFLAKNNQIEKVIFVDINEKVIDEYKKLLY